MFQYFDKEIINGKEVVDIWKNFKIEISTNDYSIHVLSEGENLMGISYKYYNTIDNWWILYIFNNMNNINFSFIQNETILNTLNKHRNDIINYNNLSLRRKAYISENVRNFYLESYSLEEAISKTNSLLLNKDTNEINSFIDYLQSVILLDSFYNTKLKIPNIGVVKEIKNKMSEYSKLWKNK